MISCRVVCLDSDNQVTAQVCDNRKQTGTNRGNNTSETADQRRGLHTNTSKARIAAAISCGKEPTQG